MAIYHYHFMVRSYSRPHQLIGNRKDYDNLMRASIASELKLMVELNGANIYHSVFAMYMKSLILRPFVAKVFSCEDMLPRKMISIAWSSGNEDVIHKCLELGIDVEPQRHVSSAIRSDNTDIVDLCVEQGASLKLPVLPYRHCRSVQMLRHLSGVRKCKLHDLKKKIPGMNLISVEYVFMGGHIEELGDLNWKLRLQGNLERSLPIKKAYLRHKRRDAKCEDLHGLGKFILLPGGLVKSIASYL